MLLLFYPFIGILDQIMPGAIYVEDVTQAEASAYLEENKFEGEPSESDLAKARKAQMRDFREGGSPKSGKTKSAISELALSWP